MNSTYWLIAPPAQSLLSETTVSHAKHMMYLRDRLGDRFTHGVVLHTGTLRLQLGDRISAIPVSALWGS